MRGTIKHILGIYLGILLLAVPCTAVNTGIKGKTVTEIRISKTTTYIKNKWKLDPRTAETVVKKAFKYGHKHQFPTAVDILAIIAIESSFNVHAVSKSKAKGLMQVLYKPTTFDINTNISDGVWLLKEYNSKLTVDGTIQAYNLGIGNYSKGMRNTDYLIKFNTIKTQLESV